ncbi:hypothetical protein, partial [Candidatus Halocynthiibacter alkanivorans]|uniref:hypothetical protein n=1 Tax=Candidatus Halocynthiibacter alkanivorans TaxID=2267619 RepID=UPI001F36A3BD
YRIRHRANFSNKRRNRLLAPLGDPKGIQRFVDILGCETTRLVFSIRPFTGKTSNRLTWGSRADNAAAHFFSTNGKPQPNSNVLAGASCTAG